MSKKVAPSKEIIIETALGIVREKGLNGLGIKELASGLHTTSKVIEETAGPIDSITDEVKEKARAIYDMYISNGLLMTPPFKGYALEFVWFAQQEKELFKLLFMSKEFASIDEFIESMGHTQDILDAIECTFHLDKDGSMCLWKDLMPMEMGMAMMAASGVCSFTTEEVSTTLGKNCRNHLIGLRIGMDSRQSMVPEQGRVLSEDGGKYIQENMDLVREENTRRLLSILIDQDKLIQSLRWNPKYLSADDWKKITNLIDKVYSRFSDRLKEKYEGITPAELRLCLLLKLGFSIKAMAAMCGISPSSITKAKQRLRARFEGSDPESTISAF